MIAAAANMVDVSHDVRAENTSVGMGVFVTSLVFTVGATAAAVAWAISVKSEIKSLRRENKNIQKEIDILRKVAGQDASETD